MSRTVPKALRGFVNNIWDPCLWKIFNTLHLLGFISVCRHNYCSFVRGKFRHHFVRCGLSLPVQFSSALLSVPLSVGSTIRLGEINLRFAAVRLDSSTWDQNSVSRKSRVSSLRLYLRYSFSTLLSSHHRTADVLPFRYG